MIMLYTASIPICWVTK